MTMEMNFVLTYILKNLLMVLSIHNFESPILITRIAVLICNCQNFQNVFCWLLLYPVSSCGQYLTMRRLINFSINFFFLCKLLIPFEFSRTIQKALMWVTKIGQTQRNEEKTS